MEKKNTQAKLFKKNYFNQIKALKKRDKLFFLAVILVIVGALASIPILTKKQWKSDILLDFEESAVYPENLISATLSSNTGKIKPGQFVAYKFSENQKKLLLSFYKQQKYIAVSFRLKFKPISYKTLLTEGESEKPIQFGFLYANDFNEDGMFCGEVKNRILGTADARLFISANAEKHGTSAELSLAIKKNLEQNELPLGFIIYSSFKTKLLGAYVKAARVGFDLTGQEPFFGLSPNGGKIEDISKADFSGCGEIFPLSNTNSSIMPKIVIAAEDTLTSESKSFTLNAGGEVLTIYKKPLTSAENSRDSDRNPSAQKRAWASKSDYILQTSLLSNPFSKFSSSDKETSIKKIIMEKNDDSLIARNVKEPLTPLVTDPGLVPLSKRNTWRNPDYELYRWDNFPSVLLFDTRDYDIQGKFFTRLAFYIEKAGYRGRILTDEEIGTMHGYNAHDYSAEGLARFFTAANNVPEVLNEKEKLLCDILVQNRIIIPSGGGSYEPGVGAVISISQSSAEYLRNSLSAHEAWHGIFFTDEDFRNTTAAIFYTIDQRAVDFLIGYWQSQSSLNYDPTDNYLIQNEFMAYIMQQGLSYTKNYFLKIANYASVQKAIPELANYVRNTNARAFEDASLAFDSYVSDRWNLSAGRIALITR